MRLTLDKSIKISEAEIRSVLSLYRQLSKQKLLTDPHDSYRVDRRNASRYFGIFPKWREKILTYFESLKKENERIMYVDICGRASGDSLGAHISYLFSFKTQKIDTFLLAKNNILVNGDLFNPTDFTQLLKTICFEKVRPAFVTFMPMAGLHDYTPVRSICVSNYEAITYAYLGKRLKDIIHILRPGGYIMLERPFQFDGTFAESVLRTPQHKMRLSLEIKKIARKLKCKVEVQSDIGGPYFLIHKPIQT